jgi:uncharacterized protein (TIGR03067 family)
LFEGRIGAVGFHPISSDDTSAEFRIEMALIDPERQIKSASLLYVVGNSRRPPFKQKEDGSFDPLPDAKRLDLEIDGQRASALLKVNVDDQHRVITFQTSYVNGAGKVMYTQIGSRDIQSSKPAAPSTPAPEVATRRPAPDSYQGPGGGGKVADLEYKEVGLKANMVLPCMYFAEDGKSFYALEKYGVLRQIAVDGLKELQSVDLRAACSWMVPSAEGILVAASGPQDVLVLDRTTFKCKLKIPVPSLDRVASAGNSSTAFATDRGGAAVSVLDLKRGKVVRQINGSDLKNLVGFGMLTMNPDGRYLFGVSFETLHRFRVDGQSLSYEESSPRIAQNGRDVNVSPDGQFICLPSGGGNYGAGPYSTFIYRVGNLRQPVLTVPSGAYPQAVGFDTRRGYVYTQNFETQLIRFTDTGVKEKEYKIPGGGGVVQIITNPHTDKILLLSDQHVYLVSQGPLTDGQADKGGSGAGKSDGGDMQKELKKFEGDWVAGESEDGGNGAVGGDPIFVEDGMISLVIRGQVTFVSKIMKLDPTASPKTIDVRYTDGPGAVGQTQLGIYDWDGDKLKICWASIGDTKRPKKFTTKPSAGRGFQYRLYERKKE